ncbi:MAG TPA: hypothetical protein VLS90_15340, partial [Thermodesulfobacteriota bacterium]|nr:hypothetical protein [Thermodesulfobacteriota bacterium]
KPSTFFILDKPSVGGFSGAPVFVLPGPYFSEDKVVTGKEIGCVGLVHGTLFDSTGGKFAAVVPSAFIAETIREAEMKFPAAGDRNGASPQKKVSPLVRSDLTSP